MIIRLLVSLFTLLIGVVASAQTPLAGTITGRVFVPGTGEYLERARISLEGSGREAFTDTLGRYSFYEVPAGVVSVKAFFTGMNVQTVTVRVTPGAVAQQDFDLVGFRQKPPGGETVKLSEFVVATKRQMDGAAIAINEQRFAPNIKNVIAADEFGPVADGNIGELLKFVPGVTLDYIDGAPMGISMSGVPADNVPVMMDGFNLASAQNATNRKVELVNISTSTLSRIEVSYTPTPESPGMALAGSVNLVPRSAFERSTPAFTSTAYLLGRSSELDFNKTPGPGLKSLRKITPGFDFSYIAPVNKKFGFTLSGGTSTQYQPTYRVSRTWRGTGTATTGDAFPDTTSDRPYMTSIAIEDSPFMATRSAAAATVDYKLSDRDRISVSVQSTYFAMVFNKRRTTYTIDRVQPGGFSPTFTQSTVGGGTITIDNNSDIDRIGKSYMPSLRYWHTGPIWKADVGLAYSYSDNFITNQAPDTAGYFSIATATRTGVTLRFDGISEVTPDKFTVTDGINGAPVDARNINSYVLTGAANNSNITTDIQRNAYVNVGRDIAWRFPVAVKMGLDFRQSARDFSRAEGNVANAVYSFVGKDGRGSTTPNAVGSDDSAAVAVDNNLYSLRPSRFGLGNYQTIDGGKLLDLWRTNPAYFTTDPTTTYTRITTNSNYAKETISSAYVRGDVSFLNGRLKFIGGVRAEQTNVIGAGLLTDPTGNYQRNASGKILLGSDGKPVLITTDALARAKLILIRRGENVNKEYLRFFPSLNSTFNLRENLIARAAYFTSVGRPNYAQYSGGLVLPDPTATPPNDTLIRVNNAGIKAWKAKTVKVMLEYYFEPVGLFSVGVFRRDTENFFGTTTLPVDAAFLSYYNLNPAEFGQHQVLTNYNIPGTVRMDGIDFNYKQALTFLPEWARGLQVFVNGSAQHKTGDVTRSFNGVTRMANWGVTYARDRLSLRMNWNLRPHEQGAPVIGRGIAPETYIWSKERLYTDLNGDYRLTRRFSIFFSARNLFDTPEGSERIGPSTPSNARLIQYVEYGALWTLGVKGTF